MQNKRQIGCRNFAKGETKKTIPLRKGSVILFFRKRQCLSQEEFGFSSNISTIKAVHRLHKPTEPNKGKGGHTLIVAQIIIISSSSVKASKSIVLTPTLWKLLISPIP